MLNDKNVKGLKVYRILKIYKDNKIMVHLKFDDGSQTGAFKNGMVHDLDEEKLTLVLDERYDGMLPCLLEHINPDSIQPFKEVGA